MNQYKKTWPISVEKEIDASTEKIWNIISKEGNLNLVHPFCKNNYALAWASENSVDVLEYLNGLTFILISSPPLGPCSVLIIKFFFLLINIP